MVLKVLYYRLDLVSLAVLEFFWAEEGDLLFVMCSVIVSTNTPHAVVVYYYYNGWLRD